MRILCRCGASFKRSGIRNHQQRSDDPPCREKIFGIGDINLNRMEEFEVDPRGDFFGDYEDYSPEEFGLAPAEDDEEILNHDGDSDDNDEEGIHDSDNDRYEISLEPTRFPNPTSSNSNDEENGPNNTQQASRLRGGAEIELRKKPYVVKFNKGKAGAVYTNHDRINGNMAYTSRINNPENPFSPFSSKIDFEIAHWAKTRGPSSTAFTELMSIKGVSCINLHTS